MAYSATDQKLIEARSRGRSVNFNDSTIDGVYVGEGPDPRGNRAGKLATTDITREDSGSNSGGTGSGGGGKVSVSDIGKVASTVAAATGHPELAIPIAAADFLLGGLLNRGNDKAANQATKAQLELAQQLVDMQQRQSNLDLPFRQDLFSALRARQNRQTPQFLPSAPAYSNPFMNRIQVPQMSFPQSTSGAPNLGAAGGNPQLATLLAQLAQMKRPFPGMTGAGASPFSGAAPTGQFFPASMTMPTGAPSGAPTGQATASGITDPRAQDLLRAALGNRMGLMGG
jgi:hypothetical protein